MKKMFALIALLVLWVNFVSCQKPPQEKTQEGSPSQEVVQTPQTDWRPLFDGKTLTSWKASESQTTWKVLDGALVSDGDRSHLFYDGTIGNHDFKNFELKLAFKLEGASNSGLFFHTEFSETASPPKGYEIQINSSSKEDKKTGSLFSVRSIYKDFLSNGEWHNLWMKVVDKRIQVKIDDILLADYIEFDGTPRSRKGRLLSSGTFALQAHDLTTKAAYKDISVKILPDDTADSDSNTSFIPDPDADFARRMDGFGAKNIPMIDFHIHLRGGMTAEKALIHQAKTGIQSGLLENAGQDWPLSDNQKIEQFIIEAEKYPVFIGLQVNDRDWFRKIDATLLNKLDYVLADTMIMNNEAGNPQKLWLEEEYQIDDPEAWMERYFQHCMTVVNEPVTILANPTYLPSRIADLYDKLWTEERMLQFIEAGIKNDVAFEFQVGSDFPKPRFIELCKEKGAKFSIGRNNHDDKPVNYNPCFDKIEKYDLKTKDMLLVPKKREFK
ncbi:MAG: DUF1080 domain-containing protein [Planctomycetaceae bacterium]|jgi:hypothetical protein|nr:DUF1080 domain-containing protein [Planctomycetaceae bacterium]